MQGASFLNVDGLSLEYRRIAARSDGGPTLVLLHEGLGCVDLWRRFPERLADATGLGVFLWSRAGFGRSDGIVLPRPLDYLELETPLVAAVLDAAGIDRAVLIGHSDGGTIALLAAAADPHDRVEGVMTMAAHVFVEEESIRGILDAKRAWEEGDLRAKLARWHGDNVTCAFHGWADTWLDPRFRGWNIEDRLPAIRAPVLAMQGEDDEYGTPAQVDAIVGGAGGPARPLLLPDCAHAPHLEQPDAVVAAVTAFLAELPLTTKPARQQDEPHAV